MTRRGNKDLHNPPRIVLWGTCDTGKPRMRILLEGLRENGADVIVGFPGESEADFMETFDFLHQLDVSYLHVFTYSERDHTTALGITPVVPMQERHQRNKTLRNLSYMKMQYFSQLHAGQIRKVLFEGHSKDGMIEGYTDNYIRVTTPYREEWINQVVDWKL